MKYLPELQSELFALVRERDMRKAQVAWEKMFPRRQWFPSKLNTQEITAFIEQLKGMIERGEL